MSKDNVDEGRIVTGVITGMQEGHASDLLSPDDSLANGREEGLIERESSDPTGEMNNEIGPMSVAEGGDATPSDEQIISRNDDSIVEQIETFPASGQVDQAKENPQEQVVKSDGVIKNEALRETAEQSGNAEVGISALSLEKAMAREQEGTGAAVTSHARPLPAPAPPPAVPASLGMYAGYQMGYQSYYRGYPTQHSTYPIPHYPAPLVAGTSPYVPTPAAAAAPGSDALTAAAHREWWAKYYEHYYKLTAYNMIPGVAPPPPPNPWALHTLPTLLSQHTTRGAESAPEISLSRKKQKVDEAAQEAKLESTKPSAEKQGDKDVDKGDVSVNIEVGEKTADTAQAKQPEGKKIGDVVRSLTNIHQR
jgi:hypothetical protein